MYTRNILIILLLALPARAISQKNVFDITTSRLTGISLPGGTKLDKRILATASARALLELRAAEAGVVVGSEIEVLTIPSLPGSGNGAAIKKSLESKGYSIRQLDSDLQYLTLKSEEKLLFAYLEEAKDETYFYIAGASAAASGQTELKSPETEKRTQDPVPAKKNIEEEPERTVAGKPQAVIAHQTSGFAFTTTNFDDGWNATAGSDYVPVRKGDVEIRLYHPMEITDQARDSGVEFSIYYWNLIAVPAFEIRKWWKWEETLTFFATYCVFAEAVDIKTGRSCFIALNTVTNSGVARPVMAITPDQTTYEQMFPHPDKLKNMLGYNRFAVAMQDLNGTWEQSSGSAANYYNVYTGASAGMAFTSSDHKFNFSSGDGTYSSTHAGASGMIGNTTFFKQDYKGIMKTSNWEIALTDRYKGETDTFEAWFEEVRGGRILHLVDKKASGIRYDLVKTK
jgi:hypothetical protein